MKECEIDNHVIYIQCMCVYLFVINDDFIINYEYRIYIVVFVSAIIYIHRSWNLARSKLNLFDLQTIKRINQYPTCFSACIPYLVLSVYVLACSSISGGRQSIIY